MKTARQAGWSLSYTKSSSGFQFVTARDDYGNYAEFWFPEPGDGNSIEQSVKNTVAFFDLPLSICQLIRFWFGTITYEEYTTVLKNL